MHESHRKSIVEENGDIMYSEKFEGSPTIETLKDEYGEAIDIFPALHKYKSEHNIINLKKLCIEISEFCRAVYASTQNDEERKVYFSMLEKLK